MVSVKLAENEFSSLPTSGEKRDTITSRLRTTRVRTTSTQAPAVRSLTRKSAAPTLAFGEFRACPQGSQPRTAPFRNTK